MLDGIAESSTPEVRRHLSSSLEMTFIEDQDALSAASKDQLRSHFKGWVSGTFPAENPHVIWQFHPGESPFQRYRYFFQVDEDALYSSNIYDPSKPPGSENDRRSYLNFVDGYWVSLVDR